MQPLIAKFLLKIHCLSGNQWRVKHNLTQHDCYPNKARISPPLFSFFFYLLLKFDQMCLLSTSWASSRLPVRNHSETTNKVIKTERRPHHMFKPWLLDSIYLFMRFMLRGSVLCSHWPASISISSSSDCSPEEPLVVPVAWLYLPFGFVAEFGLLTDQNSS